MIVPSDRPAYRILAPNGFFGPDDHLYHEGECIVFDGEPNEEMEALNEPAKQRLESYFQKLEEHARLAAEKAGRPYTGRPKSLDQAIALAHQDARQVQLISGGPGVPLMGAKKEGAPKVERLDAAPTPETGRKGRGTLSLNSRA